MENDKKNRIKISDILLKIDPRKYGIFNRYGYYIFIISIFILSFDLIILINGYVHFIEPPKYDQYGEIIGKQSEFLGYLGIFIVTAFSPLPDYFIVPIFGYISYLGLFDFWIVVLISSIADVCLMGIDYLGGRFAGRKIAMKFLKLFGNDENNLAEAENWIKEHGFISIFVATFIPFVKHATSVAAGTLKMNASLFFLSNFIGFFVRFLLLAYIGYKSIYLFSPEYDYEIRFLLILIGLLNLTFIIYYISMKIRRISEFVINLSERFKS